MYVVIIVIVIMIIVIFIIIVVTVIIRIVIFIIIFRERKWWCFLLSSIFTFLMGILSVLIVRALASLCGRKVTMMTMVTMSITVMTKMITDQNWNPRGFWLFAQKPILQFFVFQHTIHVLYHHMDHNRPYPVWVLPTLLLLTIPAGRPTMPNTLYTI